MANKKLNFADRKKQQQKSEPMSIGEWIKQQQSKPVRDPKTGKVNIMAMYYDRKRKEAENGRKH